jgi:hypothetical protein
MLKNSKPNYLTVPLEVFVYAHAFISRTCVHCLSTADCIGLNEAIKAFQKNL